MKTKQHITHWFTRLIMISACMLLVSNICSISKAQDFLTNEKSQQASSLDLFGSTAPIADSENSDPFVVTITPPKETADHSFAVSVRIATGHYLYKDHFQVTASDGTVLNPKDPIFSEIIDDSFTGEKKVVFKHDFTATYIIPEGTTITGAKVEYMGCNKEMCFMPMETQLSWGKAPEQTTPKENVSPDTNNISSVTKPTTTWQTLATSFRISASDNGSMDKEQFFAFLDRGIKADTNDGSAVIHDSTIGRTFAKYGLWITLPIIILLGIGLNLTPCVLPMIPINLAIIGAGVKAGSKGQGLFLGGIYGLGMALAYGCLGLAVVVAGSTFGALNASPWFNFITAAIFVVLSLAMFDVFTIDLSRFQKGTNVNAKTGITRYILIFGLGVFSALLAGACVAPVLIAVLLLSSTLYSSGNYIGLLLPFFLGIGMALPWPIAGAGIASLPKPGTWMTRVKQGFGILILLFAAYYAYTGFHLLQGQKSEQTSIEAVENQTQTSTTTANVNIPMDEQILQGMQQSLATGKPLFIDFWATWCKSCMYMEKTTFNDADVQKRLESEFVVLKLQAEYPKQSPTKEILEHYKVIGLPTYLVLIPEEK